MEKVNILGVEYEVKVKKMPRDVYGECDTDKKVIKINSRRDGKAESLVHEVIHGALYEAGLVHILNNTEGLEEAIVRAAEHGLKSAELIPEFPEEPKGGEECLQ